LNQLFYSNCFEACRFLHKLDPLPRKLDMPDKRIK
jgi:hypothetical protein